MRGEEAVKSSYGGENYKENTKILLGELTSRNIMEKAWINTMERAWILISNIWRFTQVDNVKWKKLPVQVYIQQLFRDKQLAEFICKV